MRRTLLIMVAMLLGAVGLQAHDYKYEPLPREGVKWVYGYYKALTEPEDFDKYKSHYEYEIYFKGDTVMNSGRSYKKMYMTFIDAPEMESSVWPLAWVRESDKRVYAVINKMHPYNKTDIVTTSDGRPKVQADDYETTGEIMLNDFNDMLGFYKKDTWPGDTIVRSDSDVVIDGYKRVTYRGKYNTMYKIAEGYGAIECSGNFLFPNRTLFTGGIHDYSTGLNYIAKENGEIVYKSRLYDKHHTAVTPVLANGGCRIAVANGEITVTAGNAATSLRLVDMSGAVVAQCHIEAGGSSSVSTAGLAQGVYAAVATWAGGVQCRKVAVR